MVILNISFAYFYNSAVSKAFVEAANNDYAILQQQNALLVEELKKEYAEKEGITEQLKATNQMKWVQKMNNIRERVMEMVNSEILFT